MRVDRHGDEVLIGVMIGMNTTIRSQGGRMSLRLLMKPRRVEVCVGRGGYVGGEDCGR